MKKHRTNRKSLYIALFAVIALTIAASIVFAAPPSKPQCRDGIDNDGDTKIDYPADLGCTSRNDNDESNCGDGVCEGGETTSTCPSDCPPPTTTTTLPPTTTTTTVPNSCSDTDGGFVTGTQGTASGSYNGQPYSRTDSCDSSTVLREFYCVSTLVANSTFNCVGNTTTQCINGACVA